MTREDVEVHILKAYGCEPEYPWFKFPGYAVYRHRENRKWFAVVMNLSKRKIGIDEEGIVDVMNLKCDPILIGSLLLKKGIFPAYHMNKGNWISVILDGSVPDQEIKWLVDMSFDLTVKKLKSQS